MRVDVLGVKFDNFTMDEAVSRAAEILNTGKAEYVVTPNPEIVWMCRKDGELKDAIDSAAMVLPDGVGIYYGSKILGRPLQGKIPGIDFISAVFAKMADRGSSVFFLGAKPGVAEAAAENIKKEYPGISIAGTNDGYFDSDAPVIEKINASKADLLLVCLGARKQELWMRDNRDSLDVRLMAGLGGSLDVFAGVVQRAPEKWQKHGFEWLYRLIKEPKRITRMIKLPLFLVAVVWQRIRGK